MGRLRKYDVNDVLFTDIKSEVQAYVLGFITADGSIGQQTLAAVNAGDPIAICNSICDQRNKYYQNIVANNPTEGKYLTGWLRRISEMRTFTTDPNGNF